MDSGNLFDDIISLELVDRLKLKYGPTSKRAGTADRSAKCDIVGKLARPVKIHVENIPGTFIVHPYVVRNLAHPINLGQSFLRKFEAEMIFRPKGILLKVRSGVTRLTERGLELTRPATDWRIQQVIELHNRLGKNPCVVNQDVLQLSRARGEPQSPLEYNRTGHRLYVMGRHVIPGSHSKYIPMKSSRPVRSLPTGDVVFVHEDGDSKIAKESMAIHPGIYKRHGGNTVAVLVTNFSQSEAVLADNCYVGYAKTARPIQTQSNHPAVGEEPLVGALEERDVSKMTPKQRADWVTFLVKELKLEENEILRADPTLKKRVIEAFMAHLPAVAVNSYDYGNTDLIKFHIQIKEGAKPVRQRLRPLNPIQAADLKRQLEEWERSGVVEESTSEWASPLVPVRKKDSDKLRWCVDFRALNTATQGDAYPLIAVENCLTQLSNAKIFSSLDSCGAYHAISIHPESRDYTSFITPHGLYRFARMPFGLKNAGSAYSRLMHIALNVFKATDFALSYLDDIIIKSNDTETHLRHLRVMLDLHHRFGLKLNLGKSDIFRTSVKYLGHIVSADGITLDPEYVKRILDWPLPKTGRELRSFLGLAGYYRSFLSEYGQLTAELTGLQTKRDDIV